MYSELDRLSNYFNKKYKEQKENKEIGAVVGNKTNVVSGEKLRNIQSDTLNETRKFLSKTFGPMGSNTKIISGNTQKDINSSYSKDGLKVLSNIINSGPIEASIVEELIEITKHVEKELGDGTTSTVILSAFIFDNLRKIEKNNNIPPYELIRKFKDIVEEIKDHILSNKKDITLDDIYNISMISTNGNESVSKDIKDIYEEFGYDVELNVGISNNESTMIKIYDGLTITEGMSDPVFINNKADNTSEIHNAKIYHFVDPIDDLNMINLFEAIIEHNIYEPIQNEQEMIPTVITCPKLSSDMSSSMKKLANILYQFDNQGAQNVKPPILIIANVVASDELIMDDIANLCGCKDIHKYIDRKVYDKDVEAGVAPTVDNVFDFAGEAELVVADAKKTKFINPLHMRGDKEDSVYTAMVNYLETEINTAADKDAVEVGMFKKRLSALKANMVDYLVGGITVSDRDNIKDLAEDAVKNCRSAAKYGVGYAANYEGLRAINKICNEIDVTIDDIDNDIKIAILNAYVDTAKILYGTVSSDHDTINNAVMKSLSYDKPYDISSGRADCISEAPNGDNVLCSIMLDINILDTIAKIITRMVTCNQCLLQASNLNTYE